MSKGYRGAGVYVFRTRRPGIIGRMPMWLPVAAGLLSWPLLLMLGYPGWPALLVLLILPRHFAYVGESNAVRLRKKAHLEGSLKYDTPPKPWADLDPSWYFIPLPGAPKAILRLVEAIVIQLLWPVYNHQKNLTNPRRIPLSAAKRQRGQRDFTGWSFNFRAAHAILWVAAAGFIWMNRGVF